MATGLSLLYSAVFSFVLWLGLYVLARDPGDPRLRYTGIGLLGYALSLGLGALAQVAVSPGTAYTLAKLQGVLALTPALFWTGVMIHLLPEETTLRSGLARVWRYSYLPVMGVLLVLGASTGFLFQARAGGLGATWGLVVVGALVLLPLLGLLGLSLNRYRFLAFRGTNGVLLVVTLFFVLGVGALVFALELFPPSLVLLALAVDLEVLGIAIAALDTFEQGETMRADMTRSFVAAQGIAAVFGVQVVLVMVTATGITLPMMGLLLLVVGTAIASQVYAAHLQAFFDGVSFWGRHKLKRERADLRAAETALPRLSDSLVVSELSAEAFERLTRKALGHFGDLSRLASSPLTRLPLVEQRLAVRGVGDNTLERAQELKRLLAESVAKLKPIGQEGFGSSDEWRYYNVLFFPYILGLKPYSRRTDALSLDSVAREALEWFRTHVPERTFYNWQKAAAALVARDLRELETQVDTLR